ncbi:MAG: hypothetical protein ACOVNS_05790 [Erythrobacter sp.]|jgi:hypothetical protein
MKSHPILIALTATIGLAGPLAAQENGGGSDTDSEQFQVIGTVPALCSVGLPDNSGGVFDMGVLVDTTTGLLRTDLAAPDKVLSGAFCSSRSTIVVDATPMVAQNFTGTPPAGFASAVDYLATARGWTVTPATFNTATSTNPAATQVRTGAFTGNIAVGVSNFATAGGASLRPVADEEYLGEITVTLSAAE